jgi:peptidyl-dipeptidase A
MLRAALFGVWAALASLPAVVLAADATREAKVFLEDAEARLAAGEALAERADWIRATNITPDTDWLSERLDADQTALAVSLAKEAQRFDGNVHDPVVARKLIILKRLAVLPSASAPGAAMELAQVSGRLSTRFATGSFTLNEKRYSLKDAEVALAKVRVPELSAAIWEGWRSITPPMREDYARMVLLANAGARELGFEDLGAMWRSEYDVSAEAFAQQVKALWAQVSPLYEELHCYVRQRLNVRYGDAVQPVSGDIRADLTGNMWGQNWSALWDVLAPSDWVGGFDLDQALRTHGYDARKMVQTAEGFYTSLGLQPLPATFWERSQFVRPEGREVDCNSSAWTIDQHSDVRVKLCLRVTAGEWRVVHHELGHDYYNLAYQDQPFLFREGVNNGFHEGIGDFIALSATTPAYLKRLGLEAADHPDEQGDLAYLLHQALDRIPLLAFALAMDEWRWGVFAGNIRPADYNNAWWSLVGRYQRLRPPHPRPADAFDVAAKYHITDNVPYMSYFMATVYLYQFQRAACQLAGVAEPLHGCSIYGNREVGARLQRMLASGRSMPTGQTLAAFTGQQQADAGAILEYYAPLYRWLKQQNASSRCTP